MNALTVIQPFAHYIALNQKPIENRRWSTNFRGELAIHAGKNRSWLDSGEDDVSAMAFGAIVAVVDVVACLPKSDPMRVSEMERWGDWRDLYQHEHAEGPHCFVLENVRRLSTPIACRGAQGFWQVPAGVEQQIREQLRQAVTV